VAGVVGERGLAASLVHLVDCPHVHAAPVSDPVAIPGPLLSLEPVRDACFLVIPQLNVFESIYIVRYFFVRMDLGRCLLSCSPCPRFTRAHRFQRRHRTFDPFAMPVVIHNDFYPVLFDVF
jgi:hypothetical protein